MKLSFSQKLMLLRKEKKISQRKLADILNIGLSNVARYENGRLPSADIVILLSDFFKISIDYLLKDENEAILIEDKEILKLASEIDRLPGPEKNKLKSIIKSYLNPS